MRNPAGLALMLLLLGSPAFADLDLADDAAEDSAAPTEKGRGLLDKMHVDLALAAGYFGTAATGDSKTPFLLQLGFGATGAWKFGSRWFAGLSSDFRFVNQYSSVVSDVGNRRGTRWNILAPTFGGRFGNVIAKLDLQFLGAYSLGNKTLGGQDVSYTNPLGFRLTGMLPVKNRFHLGLQFEYLNFSGQTLDGEESDLENQSLSTWHGGIVVGMVF
ncbi:MAG: hypothetical protein IT285_01450 [Bdellovibrionales bacterium]|nr:hypothetical protein [Bdellovibrionales bacterium]